MLSSSALREFTIVNSLRDHHIKPVIVTVTLKVKLFGKIPKADKKGVPVIFPELPVDPGDGGDGAIRSLGVLL